MVKGRAISVANLENSSISKLTARAAGASAHRGVWIAAHVRHPLLSDLRSKHWTKSVPLKPDRLPANVDPALGREILDIGRELI